MKDLIIGSKHDDPSGIGGNCSNRGRKGGGRGQMEGAAVGISLLCTRRKASSSCSSDCNGMRPVRLNCASVNIDTAAAWGNGSQSSGLGGGCHNGTWAGGLKSWATGKGGMLSVGFQAARIGVGNRKAMSGGNSNIKTRGKGVGNREVTGNAARCRTTGSGEADATGVGSWGEVGNCGSDSQPGGLGRMAVGDCGTTGALGGFDRVGARAVTSKPFASGAGVTWHSDGLAATNSG